VSVQRQRPVVSRAADVEAIKCAHPIEEVAASRGVELRRVGRALVGRCPLHEDHGRPNFYVWPETSSWFCFRCNLGGDVLRLVELVDQVDFREAVARLGVGPLEPRAPSVQPRAMPKTRAIRSHASDPDETRVRQAAAALYHRRLLADPVALAYVAGRGIDRATIESCQVGFAAGDELVAYLRWRSLPLGTALSTGLLDSSGREFLAGRIVVPDLTAHGPGWMVGRLIDDAPDPPGPEDPPKYLGLPGSKPLFGAHAASGSSAVVLVEGAFDHLTLRQWGYPSLALMGTHGSAAVLEQLRAFERVYVVLDQDDAGFEGTLRLVGALGQVAVPVALPEDVKDVATLAVNPDGPAVFAQALLEAAGHTPDLIRRAA
jgi:DNA primase